MLKRVRMNPNNQRNVGILAMVRFYSNELSAAIIETKRALELNPSSLFILDGLAFIMMLSGEWATWGRIGEKSHQTQSIP